jgi:hypothetical protein
LGYSIASWMWRNNSPKFFVSQNVFKKHSGPPTGRHWEVRCMVLGKTLPFIPMQWNAMKYPMFTMHVGHLNFRWSPGSPLCVFVYNACKNTWRFNDSLEVKVSLILKKIINDFVFYWNTTKNLKFFMKFISINMSIPHFFLLTSYTSSKSFHNLFKSYAWGLQIKEFFMNWTHYLLSSFPLVSD